MDFKETGSAWTAKGGTLSDKSARKEFGLTQDEIIEALKDGKLQYRTNYMHGTVQGCVVGKNRWQMGRLTKKKDLS